MAFATMAIRSRSSSYGGLIAAAVQLLFQIAMASADSIQGCGGFVEASATLAKLRKLSDPKLDYSQMTVELQTLDGLVKDQTQCAPNGYYFLPVYDKGTFLIKIKGPSGWSFDPEQVIAVVDQNGCNGNEDINFHYTGFTLSGRVAGAVGGPSCKNVGQGPAGVDVTLTPAGDDVPSANKISVKTVAGGTFEFGNLLTGKYKIDAFHSKLNVTIKGAPEVELGWGNVVLDDILFVSGYTVEGTVVSQGNPVLGVQVYLHSTDVSNVYCPQGPGNSPRSETAVCHVNSDADGRFKFWNIPCGVYTLIPYYKGENTVFDVSPASIDIAVRHEAVVIAKPFQVTGFSVGGRVVDSYGHGIGNVKLFIDETERTTTDGEGYYKLDQVTSTRYTIGAMKEHYTFSSLNDFMVLPNMASIPDLKAIRYHVCGVLRTITVDVAKRQVALTHGPENVKPQTKRVDQTGSFCFEVPPGEYRLSPLTTSVESQSGLIFSPSHLDITVTEPLLDILFSQAHVSISGLVLCKEQCSSQVSISLTTGGLKDSTEPRWTTLNEQGEFVIEQVFPGKYSLQVQHKPPVEGLFWEENWCWNQNLIDIEVATTNITGVIFEQKGVWLHIESTHAAMASLLSRHGNEIPLQITKGWQCICVEEPGTHELQFVQPCVLFGESSFFFESSNPKPIRLSGQKFLLTGHIHIDSRLYGDTNKLVNTILVDVTQQENILEQVSVGKLVKGANDTSPVAIYAYEHWARFGDKLIFSPRHARGDVITRSADQQENNAVVPTILFYPREQQVHVVDDGCQPNIGEFYGRPGIYINGYVTPALQGVNIDVISESDSAAGRLRRGEVAFKTVTLEDGSYTAGPLFDDTTYRVQAEKSGYHLKAIGNHLFSCEKLGRIIVEVSPGEGAEEFMPTVLLSLSGENGYRKNAVTGPGNFFSFDDLFPGTFYLRPLLKEYTFTPPAQAVEIGSGDHIKVRFIAKRVAYSVLGTVTSLSGKPEEGISMEARAESRGYYDETVTDADGKYRLRGLLPDTSYVVKVVIKNDTEGVRIERASPQYAAIQVHSRDTTGVDFVVFDYPTSSYVTGEVEGPNLERWQPFITVEIVSTLEPHKIERTIPLPLSYFFELQDLPKGKYTVKLELGLSSRTHTFESDVIELDLETKSHAHVGPIKFRAEEHQQKQDLTSAPVFPIVVGVAVIALFASMPRIKDGYQWVTDITNTAAAPIGPKKDMRKVGLRKRTY
ncbi:hypothetical protein O6H91_13G097300 [Diphasiastrum complanatum]|uniref:Uncharacterized protein n=1 Tax=Diphasiastrum complanatum TaxID=34168 RepID=A0ACC2BXM1_DIPCM|nr:hypothetical protein O6H91_13G097300 [Diphasiastrum complanatum]